MENDESVALLSGKQDSSRGGLRVVGIGASAGGLEALEQFFDNMPKTYELAFVVVQHLSPDFKSLMDELLARHTTMPIHRVEDGMVLNAWVSWRKSKEMGSGWHFAAHHRPALRPDFRR